jgi:choline-sulfatase
MHPERWASAALAALSLWSCPAIWAAPSQRAAPNVLLITVDTLRPDALGWVAGHNDTPAFDALAREGVRFAAAVSPVPLTLPAHASLLTGRLPRHHGVRDNGQVLALGIPTLAESLQARGYATAAFISGFTLRRGFGLARGFAHYDDTLPVGAEGWTERPAPDTVAAVLAWLRSAASPWFVWVHFYDAHDPYDPPRAFWRPGPRGAYDGEVAYIDHALATLRAALRGDPDNVLTVLAADHGESLGEHGEGTHGFFVYDSTLLVPVVFHWPGRLRPAASELPARLVDLTPTVLALLGAPPLPETDGISLVPTLEGNAQKIPPAYVESRQPWLAYGWSPLKGLRSSDFKLIDAPRRELYDLRADPGETRDLAKQGGVAMAELERLMARVEARPEAASAPAIQDADTVEALRALGYVSAGHGMPPIAVGLPDPKDRLGELARLAEAEGLLRRGDGARALPLFEGVLKDDPNNRFASLRSGLALLKLQRPAEAVARLEQAVRLDPEQAESRFALADALTRLGRTSEALAQWREVVRLQPGREAAWANMATVLARVGRWAEALAALERASSLAPQDQTIRANLAAMRAQRAAPQTSRP